MSGSVEGQLREGLGVHGYSRAEDGLVWETYLGDDLVVQCPARGDEGLVPRAAFLYSHVGGSGARIPAVVDYREDPPACLVVRKAGDVQLSELDAGRERELAAVESAGEALGQVHSAGGFGYGAIQGEEYRQGGHHTWRAFAEDLVERTVAYTAGGEFEAVVRAVAGEFDPGSVPERPEPSVLHNDFRGDNVVIDGTDRAWVVDLDNAIYGDSRFDYVQSLGEIAGDDGGARAAFRRGYERSHGLELGDELRDLYGLLSIAKRARDGEWCRRNTGIETDAWAAALVDQYRTSFG